MTTVQIHDPARGTYEFDLREPTPEEEDKYLIKRRPRLVAGEVVDASSDARMELFDILLVEARMDGKKFPDGEVIPRRYKFMTIFQAFENFSVEVLEKN